MQTRSVHFKRYNNAVDNHSVTIFMGGWIAAVYRN